MITIATIACNKVTGIIHVRLAAFQSEMKGWFYKRSTTTGIALSKGHGGFHKSRNVHKERHNLTDKANFYMITCVGDS